MPLAGGHSAVHPITLELKEEVMKDLHPKLLQEAEGTFEPTHYRSQVVAGTIYHFRLVDEANDKVLYVRAFRGLPHTGDTSLQLVKVREKALSEEGEVALPHVL